MSTNFNLDLAGISRVAMRRAGLLSEYDSPSGPEQTVCGEFLNLQLKSWQLAGKMLRQTERTTTVIDATARSTGVVAIAADTIDIETPIALTLSSGTQTYVVKQSSRSDWLSDTQSRTTVGIPTDALIERGSTVQLTLFPLPNTDVVSIEYTRVRLIADINNGENAEVLQRCIDAVVLGLQVDLLEWKNKDDVKIARTQARYEIAKAAVLTDAIERGPVKFSLR